MRPIRGPVRIDRRTKNLVKRLRRGEVAVIDHRDLDAVAAESLVACGAAAVINASESISGRYPNMGPGILLRAGIPVLDNVGNEILDALREGDQVELDLAGGVLRNGSKQFRGTPLTAELVSERAAQGRANLQAELRRFVENTLHIVTCEDHLLLDRLELPEIRTRLEKRPALIVVRGEGYREDLRAVRTYIDEIRPVLIAVDGGADALLEMGLRPHVIVGDMDSVTDTALRCGAELVVHAYADGRAPGSERLKSLGMEFSTVRASGTSEDIAMLLAYEKGAELLIAVGTHSSLVDFLDKGRPGMSSTFLTRLRIGSRLVDARGVSKLYQRRLRWYHVAVPFLLGTLAILGAFLISPGFRSILSEFSMHWILRRY